MKPLTIAYFTCRRDPKIEWFFKSLNRELKGDWNNIHIIIIDYWFQYEPISRQEDFAIHYKNYTNNVLHISPKPCPVQGKYKVTKNDYFAASNARNTAFINCTTDYIVCIDDLTVIKEGWLDVVLWGQKNDFVLCGSYAKVKNLQCNDDGSYSFNKDSLKNGLDSRFNNPYVTNSFATKVAGSWLFGCSFALPLSLAFEVNGFDECADTIGSEDYLFGIRLGRATGNIYYSKKMFTYEDDDLHFAPGNVKFIRESYQLTENTLMKSKIGVMSDHALLQYVMESNSYQPILCSYLLENIKATYHQDKLKLTENYGTLRYWVNGKLLSEM